VTSSTAKLRRDAMAIFHSGLAAVNPTSAVLNALKLSNSELTVGPKSYDVRAFENIFVVGAGKAGAAMAAAVETVLGDRIYAGIVNVKYGHTQPLDHVRIVEAGHPVPDTAGLQGTREIVDLLSRAGDKDLVICLLSGGGSALLPLPCEGITLAEKQATTQRLLDCGATINEINTVRKHISAVKGGQLARVAYPATLITLVLSDVIGDPLDVIASGPTVADSSTFADVAAIVTRHDLWQSLPVSIQSHIRAGERGRLAETPKVGETVFERTQNIIIASNRQALAAAKTEATQLGYHAMVLSSSVQGETRDVALVHSAIAKEILSTAQPLPPPGCIISGGETTVTMRGQGKGGRNQEFVLAAAIDIADMGRVVILSAGTDGTDGPTDAAGAICDGYTIQRADKLALLPRAHLDNNDAYPFFEQLGDLIKTGPTHTNVMDLRLILVGEP
jgi:hydroxypyruvate reductase